MAVPTVSAHTGDPESPPVLVEATTVAPVAPDPTKRALILAESIRAGTATDGSGKSLEEQQAEAAGFTVDIKTAAEWESMTNVQFAAYRVLIVGDPQCSSGYFGGAEATAGTWGPVVRNSGGNRVIIGTDPAYHAIAGAPGAATLTRNGIAFAGAKAGSTGFYLALSCAGGTVPPAILDALTTHPAGEFTIVGNETCNVNLVAQSGPTSGLHDSDIQGWGCSVHESFHAWPSDFTPLGVENFGAETSGAVYCAKDVDTGAPVCGQPYILIAGADVVISSDITLTPAAATNPVGTDHTVTATVKNSDNNPRPGVTVTFRVESGPNVGKTGSAVTDSNGQASFTYHDDGGAGTDSISATFTNPQGAQEKATATKTWAGGEGGPVPSLSIDDVSTTEGDDGTHDVVFTVSLSGASSAPVTVSYETHNGTAEAGRDFNQMGGMLTFSPGETQKQVPITVIGDTLNEADETFFVDLSTPSGATCGKCRGNGTIVNDDPRAKVFVSDVSVTEGDSGQVRAVFKVTLDRPSGEVVGVDYATQDGSAVSGADYVSKSGSLSFDPGQTSRDVIVMVNGDTSVETNETFFLNLVGSSGVEYGNTRGTATIVDDDKPPPPVFKEDVDGGKVSGSVCYQLPGSSTCQPLEAPVQFPIGTIIDATKGRVTLTIVDANGNEQSADFYEGRFVIAEQTDDGTLLLKLVGGDFSTCSAPQRVLAAGPPKKGGTSVRHLWGDGKGKFRTQGRYASATVAGTKWLTDDRCEGTLVFVEEGIINAVDLVLNKTITLTAGQSYLAQPTGLLPQKTIVQCRTVNGKRVCHRIKFACRKINGKNVCKRIGTAKGKKPRRP